MCLPELRQLAAESVCPCLKVLSFWLLAQVRDVAGKLVNDGLQLLQRYVLDDLYVRDGEEIVQVDVTRLPSFRHVAILSCLNGRVTL